MGGGKGGEARARAHHVLSHTPCPSRACQPLSHRVKLPNRSEAVCYPRSGCYRQVFAVFLNVLCLDVGAALFFSKRLLLGPALSLPTVASAGCKDERGARRARRGQEMREKRRREEGKKERRGGSTPWRESG
eukprot:234124-Rhodomonas_salina.1